MPRYARLTALVCLGLLPHVLDAEEVAAPPPEIPEAVRALFAQRKAATSVRGRFTGETVDAQGASTGRRVGDFAVRRQDGAPAYHLKMARPDGGDLERWCSDGKRSWHVEQADPQWPVDVQERPPEGDGDIRRIVDCILLELPALARDFRLTVEPAATGPGAVVLTPRGEDLAKDVARIRVRLDAAGEPQELAIQDAQGGVFTVQLTEVVRNQPIDPALFTAR